MLFSQQIENSHVQYQNLWELVPDQQSLRNPLVPRYKFFVKFSSYLQVQWTEKSLNKGREFYCLCSCQPTLKLTLFNKMDSCEPGLTSWNFFFSFYRKIVPSCLLYHGHQFASARPKAEGL